MEDTGHSFLFLLVSPLEVSRNSIERHRAQMAETSMTQEMEKKEVVEFVLGMVSILLSPYHRTHLYLQTFHWTHSSSSWLSTGISRRGSTPIKGRGTPPTLLRPSQQIELLFPNLELKWRKKLSTINCLDLTTKMLTSAANRARAALHTFVPFCFLSSDLRFFIDH